ncbi:putative low affinity copper uptake protein 2 [Holothuria leucospilota]|uniref:Copper transport protein n=1 Tax=Holothuria leucospilota TaxID=206669 RepID=A0A9Q1C4W5_HOLLE|nr:putative low affinity copper uptake protein 2 [Holothuria leucospilota]
MVTGGAGLVQYMGIASKVENRSSQIMEDQYFHFNTTIENILFKNWSPQWSWGFILTFLFFLFLAIVLEAVAHLELLLTRYYESSPFTWSWQSQRLVNNSLLAPLRIPSSLTKIKYRRLRIHVARSVMHIPRVILGYFLMLAVMTYNAYMFIAIVIGSAIGYFFFSHLEYHRMSNKYSRKDLIVSSNAGENAETDSSSEQQQS